ncbi:periplasmic heavy metal sensor [Geitlerinema sp. P-1104]|uniref:Spy/CpxP family protein refolding chaperone n=1 Tax=Geitlerinema sp. P-1104 TaxID=2546230 RepID=UPI0014770923|nr:Spy/CpxP family protein refolding chaperone [Geitlerinema sp. P-1104]NMG57133.1 periplasmic heavy metal sensor [Geitlerinema sp. P-1104]
MANSTGFNTRFNNKHCTRKAVLWGLLGFLALGTVTSSYANAEDLRPRQNQMSQRGPRDRGQMRWMERLDLTPEQTNSIQAIRDRYQPQIDSVRERMQQQRDTMHSIMGSNASAEEIRQQRQQMMQLRDEMSELRFNSMMEIREVLTEEQRAEVRDWMEERRGERGERGGHGREGRRGPGGMR